MNSNRLMFVLFALAIFFSMVHEYELPSACLRPTPTETSVIQPLAR